MARKAAPKASTPPDGEIVVVPAADLTAPPNLAPEPKPKWTGDAEQSDHVFARIGSADKLTEIVADFDGLSLTSFLRWLERPDNAELYARARDFRAHAIANRLYELGDKVQRGGIAPDAARVAADIYKWTAAKMLPKSYGDKVEHSGQVQISLVQALADLSAMPVPQLPPLPKD